MADKSITEGTVDLKQASKVPSSDDLFRFAYQVASFVAEGDQVDGEEYVMENDDAWETINGLIHEARQIFGLPEVMKH
jgi:hypothetical protein